MWPVYLASMPLAPKDHGNRHSIREGVRVSRSAGLSKPRLVFGLRPLMLVRMLRRSSWLALRAGWLSRITERLPRTGTPRMSDHPRTNLRQVVSSHIQVNSNAGWHYARNE